MNGLVVNGDNVTALGLAVEHYEQRRCSGTAKAAKPSSTRAKCPMTFPASPHG